MLLYRVFPHRPGARRGQPGHAMYVHTPQGSGRLDNPDHYLVRYFALSPEAAVGESFADLTTWRPSMFTFPGLPGGARALGTYGLPDETRILDLDDARALLDRGLRPTQVVIRNRPGTQAWALHILQEPTGWAGVRWWSYHRPQWPVVGLWDDASLEHRRTERLDLDHPAVADAAATLSKERRT